jgi:ABC-2 type transport system permease protein
MWWSIGVFAMVLINMIFYPSFKDQAETLQKSFDNLPDAAVQLFGGSTDFFSAIGFLNSQIFFLTLPLVLGILAIGLGSSLIGKDEQDLTIESLLARPVPRSKLLLAKASAGLIILTVVSLAGLVTIILTAWFVDLAVPAKLMFLANLACFLLVLSFGAVAFLLSSIGRARGAGIGIATFVAFGGYLISSLAGTVSWLEVPAKAFPFHYYQPEAILRQTFSWNNLYFFIGVILICAIASWFSFRRRDIY